ncbi:MAG: hypothetical protein E7214_12480 [Clostridium sp.]|nr:hypothetical protein [Clostridium sp.]
MYYRMPDEFFVKVVPVDDLDIYEEEYRGISEEIEMVQGKKYLEEGSIEVEALEESDEEYVESEINQDADLV